MTKIEQLESEIKKTNGLNKTEVQRMRRQLTQEAWLMFQKIFNFWHTSDYEAKKSGRLYNLTDRAYKRYKRRSLKLINLSYPSVTSPTNI